MHLIAPDILTEARGLTGAMLGTVCALGLALWLFGWRWHRFWVVSGITLGAGLLGLGAGRAAGGTQVMAVGILLAIAAGMMALELAKVIAFVAGGIGAWLTVQWVLPQAQELWAVFLSGGLFGLLLYRLWTMLLTSLMGTLLATHAGLLLLERSLKFDAVAWSAAHAAALNGLTVALVVLGILVQSLVSREPAATGQASSEKKPKKGKKQHKSDRDHDDDHDRDHDHDHHHDRHELRKAARVADSSFDPLTR